MKKVVASLLLLVLAGSQSELFGGKNGKKKRKRQEQTAAQIERENAKKTLDCININETNLSIPHIDLHSKEELTKAFIGLYTHITLLKPTQEMEQPLHHLTLVLDALDKKHGDNGQKTKLELCGYADNARSEIAQLQEYLKYKGNLEQVTNPDLIKVGILSGYTSPWKGIYEIMKAKRGLVEGCSNAIAEREKKLKELKDEVRNVSGQISLYQGAKESHEQGFKSLKQYSKLLIKMLQAKIEDCDSEVESYSNSIVKANELLADLRKDDPSSDSFEKEKKNYEDSIHEANKKIEIAKQQRIATQRAIDHLKFYLPKARQDGSIARKFGLV